MLAGELPGPGLADDDAVQVVVALDRNPGHVEMSSQGGGAILIGVVAGGEELAALDNVPLADHGGVVDHGLAVEGVVVVQAVGDDVALGGAYPDLVGGDRNHLAGDVAPHRPEKGAVPLLHRLTLPARGHGLYVGGLPSGKAHGLGLVLLGHEEAAGLDAALQGDEVAGQGEQIVPRGDEILDLGSGKGDHPVSQDGGDVVVPAVPVLREGHRDGTAGDGVNHLALAGAGVDEGGVHEAIRSLDGVHGHLGVQPHLH